MEGVMVGLAGVEQMPLCVVMPAFEDSVSCARLLGDLAARFDRRLRVVAVDDGSIHDQLDATHLRDAGVNGTVLHLRRNVGHQRALTIGLGYALETARDGELFVLMDGDGEDRPQNVDDLLRMFGAGGVDVVVALRRTRLEGRLFRVLYGVYRSLFALLTGQRIGFGNFMIMSRFAALRLVAMRELSTHIAAAVLASKLRIGGCAIDRGPRYAGRSRMRFVDLVLHGFRAMTVFSDTVLVRVSIASGTVGLLSCALIVVAVLLKLAGFSTPGWFSIAVGILSLMVLQAATLALLTLALTGLSRSGRVVEQGDYRHYIERELPVFAGHASALAASAVRESG
jgi:polyisoprenyl-phosphate glycosyltransferase